MTTIIFLSCLPTYLLFLFIKPQLSQFYWQNNGAYIIRIGYNGNIINSQMWIVS